LAVLIARRLFHLPYVFAEMRAECSQDGTIRFRSQRRHYRNPAAASCFEYAQGARLPVPEAGSLEFFLVERYLLFSRVGQSLMSGRVWHEPYALCQPKLTAWDTNLCELNGFTQPMRPPDDALMSPGVDVQVFPLACAPDA